MRAPRWLLATVVLVSVMSAGCSDPTEEYCAALAEEKATLERLSARAGEPSSGALSDGIDVFERLQDVAPQELRDEWTTYVIAWQGLEAALERAGVDAGVFEEGKRPPGVGREEYDGVRDAADKLRSQPVIDAAGGIEDHATEVCDVDLGGAGL